MASIAEPLMPATRPQFSSAFHSQIWLCPVHPCVDQLTALSGQENLVNSLKKYLCYDARKKREKMNNADNQILHTFELKNC